MGFHSTSCKFCIECNKDIKRKKPFMINWDNQKGKCIPLEGPNEPDDGDRRERGADYGLQYIGSDCMKKYPKNWITTEPEELA